MSHLENKKYLLTILAGARPSQVFNSILKINEEMDKYDLANFFAEEYELLDSKTVQLIWHWKSIKSIRGISDEQLDEHVLSQMREVGYKV